MITIKQYQQQTNEIFEILIIFSSLLFCEITVTFINPESEKKKKLNEKQD